MVWYVTLTLMYFFFLNRKYLIRYILMYLIYSCFSDTTKLAMLCYSAAWAWGHRKGIITHTRLILTQQTPSNTYRFVTQFCTHPVCEALVNLSFVHLRLSHSRPVVWILRSGLSVPKRWKRRTTKGLIIYNFLSKIICFQCKRD